MHRIHVAMREAEAGATCIEQQRSVEVGAPHHARLLEPTDRQRLALR